MVGVAIVAILAAIAVPGYQSYRKRVMVATAENDIVSIAMAVQQYNSSNNAYPPDLATIGMAGKIDPWGNPYLYLSFAGLNGKGQMRKDKNLNPINTQYDLYSVGADGQSKLPLTVKVSQDDVIWALDGNYVGLAANF
jgi:general secretion pathway protein G